MKSRLGLSLGLALMVLLFAAGCQQDAADATPSPEVVDVVPVAGTAEPLGAYPAPAENGVQSAYPGPDTGNPAAPVSPDATPEPGTDPAQPPISGQPDTPVFFLPLISESDVTVEPLPEAGVFAPPEGSADIAPGSSVQHTVIRGDWLLQVARCYGTSYEAVRNANSLPFPDYIMPGTILTVPNVGSVGPIIGAPCVVEYTVQSGDTWEGLASFYETSVAVLQRVNPGPLTAGRAIFVPATAPANATLPMLTHHLVFNFGGDLAIWRSTDSLVEVTLDSPTILDLATNSTGQYVLVRQTRDGEATNEIALIDTVARTSVVVETGLPAQANDNPGSPVHRLHISPDGTWAVYALETGGTYSLTSFQTAAPGTRYTASGFPYDATAGIFGLLLADSVTGTSFLVSDATGVVDYPYSLDRSPRTIVALSGPSQTLPNQFFNITPVPGSQYLLAVGGFFEGVVYFVIDAQTGAYGPVPNSGAFVISGATFATTDGRIVVVAPTEAGAAGPLWTTYEVQTVGQEVTFNPILEETLPTLAQPAAGEPMPGYVIGAPAVQRNDTPYTITINGSPNESGLWATDTPGAALLRLNAIPEGSMMQTWVPDGSGLLATTYEGAQGYPRVTYVSSVGDPLLSLTDWLGLPIGDMFWVQQLP